MLTPDSLRNCTSYHITHNSPLTIASITIASKWLHTSNEQATRRPPKLKSGLIWLIVHQTKGWILKIDPSWYIGHAAFHYWVSLSLHLTRPTRPTCGKSLIFLSLSSQTDKRPHYWIFLKRRKKEKSSSLLGGASSSYASLPTHRKSFNIVFKQPPLLSTSTQTQLSLFSDLLPLTPPPKTHYRRPQQQNRLLRLNSTVCTTPQLYFWLPFYIYLHEIFFAPFSGWNQNAGCSYPC